MKAIVIDQYKEVDYREESREDGTILRMPCLETVHYDIVANGEPLPDILNHDVVVLLPETVREIATQLSAAALVISHFARWLERGGGDSVREREQIRAIDQLTVKLCQDLEP